LAGIAKPNALAAAKLIVRKYQGGYLTGKSPTLAPRKTLSA
jgi:hypothetical protein